MSFVCFWLHWVFVAACRPFAVGVSRGYLLVVSPRLQSTGSATVTHRPGCSVARGIFLDQGSNPALLHWQVDALPLSHQECPYKWLFNMWKEPSHKENSGSLLLTWTSKTSEISFHRENVRGRLGILFNLNCENKRTPIPPAGDMVDFAARGGPREQVRRERGGKGGHSGCVEGHTHPDERQVKR